MMIQLDISQVFRIISKEQIFSQSVLVKDCNKSLENRNGKGNNFLGWLHLPSSITKKEIEDIQSTANNFRNQCEVVVIIGIGGSYLGAKAVIEALSNKFDKLDAKKTIITYAGHHISEDYFYELSTFLKKKSFGIINISKSGTTIEPALAFRFFKKQLEDSIGKKEAKNRIVAVTDQKFGKLRELASKEEYKTYVIPNNICGRFSVLTPAGLLPIAISGIDINSLISGALRMEQATASTIIFEENLAEKYAITRNELYKIGKKIEIIANFHPKLNYISEWWKQLYGESEGKEHKGIFTASANYTTDLHSIGQWVQEAERSIFETVISINKPKYKVKVPWDIDDLDKLNFIAYKRVDYINKMAELGTQMAHVEGGVPNIRIILPILNEYYVGQLLYFFERACGISGYLLGVNPFDQPGVEFYKKNMISLLNKKNTAQIIKI